MDEVALLLKSLTKGEMINIIKEFDIKVQGFQRNFNRAPHSILSAAINNELKKNGGRRKQVRKISIKQIYHYLFNSVLDIKPNIKEMSLDDFEYMLNLNTELSESSILSIIFIRFPDIYQSNKHKILHNLENNLFILKDIVKEISTEEKIQLLKERVRNDNDIRSKLEMITSLVKKEVGNKYYENLSQKVNEYGDDSFVQTVHFKTNEEQQIMILAYLNENERYKQEKYSDFTLSTISYFTEKLIKEKENHISDLQQRIDKMNIEVNQNISLRNQIINIKDEYKDIEVKYTEVCEKYDGLLRTNDGLITKIEKVSPFLSFFNDIVKKNNIIIVTHHIFPFLDTPLENSIISFEQFKEDRTNGDIERYINKTIFITRVTFKNTPNWLTNKRFLEKNKLSFFELSGYGIEEYIEQIIQYIYKDRGGNSNDYINT